MTAPAGEDGGIRVQEAILAIVALRRDAVEGGAAPVFYARNAEEQQKIAFLLTRILNAFAHDLGNGTLIIVKH
ncbi:MAG: hypothetical protein QJR14_07215 [Bacillota bacterium]|nr:hypothetical protein [Bacillota bacterium]